MSDVEIIAREATPNDRAYVAMTWMKSWANDMGSGSRRRKAEDKFLADEIHPTLDAQPTIWVLCSRSSPRTLHGYAVVQNGVLCWVYVARALRGMGLARRGIEAALGGYPDDIRVRHKWPWPSRRFRHAQRAA